MAESMIARMAEAIGNGVYRELGSPSDWCPADGAIETVAREVLAAMRDFTEEMDFRQFGYDGRESICMIDRSADEVWQWVIDQALDGA